MANFGDFEDRGAAKFQNKQQSTWRNGVEWKVGERVSMLRCRMMPHPNPTAWRTKISEPTKTRVFGTITGFESNYFNRPSVKWDEQPAPFDTPPHFLQEWHSISKA
jgi:hypothetical protein